MPFVLTFSFYFRDHGAFWPFVVTFGSFLVTVVSLGMPIVVTFGSFLETMVSFGIPFVVTFGSFFKTMVSLGMPFGGNIWVVFGDRRAF